ncbi:MAG: Hsp20/alpha crystallin family protein [Candidatus Eisenbacteria sp.]|nr:Hsp20/alpha crystallin family protein [Candidatus Eisenbacteria bacterium]
MLVRWRPRFGLAHSDEFDRFFDDMFQSGRGVGSSEDRAWMPCVDVAEKDSAYELKAELPGMKKEDIQVVFDDGELVLRGERKWEGEDQNGKYRRIEGRYGRFERRFALPEGVKADDVEAEYKDGILSVVLPKIEAPELKQIPVEIK